MASTGQEDLSPLGVVLLCMTSVTCSLCLAVVLTNVCFKSMRYRLFMHIICMISLCDLLGNLAQFYPMHHNLCTFHGIWYFFFFGASYAWTVLLSYLLYGLATQGQVVMKLSSMHVVAWSSAAVRGLLPYSSSLYVRDGEWCNIGPRPGYGAAWADFWNILVFPVWIGFCFAIIISFRWKIHNEIKK
jgi:hypothetical protein